jgi:hypothetical protein
MPARKSGNVCPTCGEFGGFLSERCVKYNINIPPRSKIKTVVDAWDYGARVSLRMADDLMLFPPDDKMSSYMANHMYKLWRHFTSHTDEQLQALVSKLLKVIPKSVKSRVKYLVSKYTGSDKFYDGTPKHIRDPIHVRLPEKRVIATKASVSLVFVACVCLTLRDLFSDGSAEKYTQFVRGIYTYFSLMESTADLRNYDNFYGYFDKYDMIEKYGFYRASRMIKQSTNICKPCSEKNKEIVYMIKDQETESWKCSVCNKYDPIISHYSIRHLKDKAAIIQDKKSEWAESIPEFLGFVMSLIEDLKSNLPICTVFMNIFDNYEKRAEKGMLLCTKRQFWAHYDNSKKSKRRWCPIKSDLTSRLKSDQYQKVVTPKLT